MNRTGQAEALIHRLEEEQARKQNHHDDEDSRDQGFPARRPRDLVRFGTNFLQELERISHCSQLLAANRQQT